MKTQHQFQLFKEKRFTPYFFVQLLGVLNDNIFKNGLLTLIAFSTMAQAERALLTNVGALIFIFPFFIFSALAGQLADKYNKVILIRYIKLAELPIMIGGGIAFWLNDIYLLLGILFLMGTQSAFFAPVKYSILPQFLESSELVGGNGLVEMGTFTAILIGTIVGILLLQLPSTPLYICGVLLIIALLGLGFSLLIPNQQKTQLPHSIKIHWEPLTHTWQLIKRVKAQRTIFLVILGISWFWFFGAIIITQLYNYNQDVINGNAFVMTCLLSLISIGIASGSLSCEKLSGHKIEIGLVPFGSIGLTLIAIDLSFAHGPFPEQTLTLTYFLQSWTGWHILIDLFFIGFFAGLYSVPLYVLLQTRTKEQERSQMIAANSVFNAFFMVVASLFAISLLALGLSIPQLILVLGFCNLAVTLYLYKLLPEFFLRFVAWFLIHSMYRIQSNGLDHIPETGPAVITCNHVSLVDPIIVMACSKRPIRFVMDYQIFKIPVLNFLFKTAGCIPVASEKESPEIKERAFVLVKEALDRGDLVGLFPEGGLTKDGSIQPFRRGLERILADNPVPIIPMAVCGLWGSFFSRRYGKLMRHWPRQFLFAKIALRIGPAIPAQQFDLLKLKEITEALREDWL